MEQTNEQTNKSVKNKRYYDQNQCDEIVEANKGSNRVLLVTVLHRGAIQAVVQGDGLVPAPVRLKHAVLCIPRIGHAEFIQTLIRPVSVGHKVPGERDFIDAPLGRVGELSQLWGAVLVARVLAQLSEPSGGDLLPEVTGGFFSNSNWRDSISEGKMYVTPSATGLATRMLSDCARAA